MGQQRSAFCWLPLALLALYALLLCDTTYADYPGVIELVGYSNRRARTYYIPPSLTDTPTLAPPAAKTQADIETVKKNIEKYNRLLTLDTKNLPESQKDMLERIVERVARLKESLDIQEQFRSEAAATAAAAAAASGTDAGQQNVVNAEQTDEDATAVPPPATTLQMESETDPTLLLDETTLLHLQSSMNEQAAMQAAAVTAQTTLMQDIPTTMNSDELTAAETVAAGASQTAPASLPVGSTDVPLVGETEPESEDESAVTTAESVENEYGSTTNDDQLTDATDPDDQFVAARSNNNIAAITAADPDPSTSSTTTTAGNQRTLTTSGKLKTRGTKRPLSTKVSSSSGGKRRPSNGSKQTTKQKLNSGATVSVTTAHPLSTLSSSSSSLSASSSLSSSSPYQQKLQTKPQHQYYSKVSSTTPHNAAIAAEQMYQRTPQANIAVPAAAAAAAAASSYTSSNNNNNNNVGNDAAFAYDAHVNTSAIIDSLSSHAREEYYQQQQQQQQQQHNHHQQQQQPQLQHYNTKQTVTINNKDNKKPIATAKPTKYHYYPHNQHIYLLPECAIQQVCNAVYVRLNYTQPLCACPSRYRDPCSASLNEDDQHTTKLIGDGKKKAITLAKTCEATTEMRECRSPKDWSLLALQNTRTGKSHYLVICRCPDHFKMEGPMAHDQPTYASVPGIRVFGMMCVKPGYSVRKPSAQPPKRYQLQKPYYRPGAQTSYISGGSVSNSGLSSSALSNTNQNQYTSGTKDSYGRPIYGGGSVGGGNGNGGAGGGGGSSAISANYQPQDSFHQNQGHHANYQYLNRPDNTQQHNAPNFRPDTFSINNFPGSNYGRNNERRGDPPIEAAADSADDKQSTSTQSSSSFEEARTTLNTELDKTIGEQPKERVAVESEVPTTPVENNPPSETESKPRERRSLVVNAADGIAFEEDTPAFPWDRVLEFQQTIVWD